MSHSPCYFGRMKHLPEQHRPTIGRENKGVKMNLTIDKKIKSALTKAVRLTGMREAELLKICLGLYLRRHNQTQNHARLAPALQPIV